MNKEKVKETWLKIWFASGIAFTVAIIPLFLFERGAGEALKSIKPDSLTIFGFCFLTIFCFWIFFSMVCIHQITKPKYNKEMER